MNARRSLKNRRPCHTFGLRYGGTDFTLGVGVFEDGEPAEVFVTGPKAGSDIQGIARDAAVLLSLALQFGVPLQTMRHAITRSDERDTPASVLGAIADAIEGERPRLQALAEGMAAVAVTK